MIAEIAVLLVLAGSAFWAGKQYAKMRRIDSAYDNSMIVKELERKLEEAKAKVKQKVEEVTITKPVYGDAVPVILYKAYKPSYGSIGGYSYTNEHNKSYHLTYKEAYETRKEQVQSVNAFLIGGKYYTFTAMTELVVEGGSDATSTE